LKPLENLENPFQGNQEAQEGQLESRDDALRPLLKALVLTSHLYSAVLNWCLALINVN
jgi:hypothetical protein